MTAAPTDSAPPAARRGDIQGLRALAVLLVVVYHAGGVLHGGYIGVDVFFVVSGYVITRMIVREMETTGRLDLWRFYLRRIRRLLPALALVLAVTVVAAILFVPIRGQQLTGNTGAAAAVFNANNYLALQSSASGGYFATGAELNPLLHMWSLSVEEQFYLVVPGLLLLGWLIAARRRWRGRVVVGVVLATVALTSYAVSWLLLHRRLDPVRPRP